MAEVTNENMHRVDIYCGGIMVYHISLWAKKKNQIAENYFCRNL